jgi:intergrase/recombinase
VKDRISWLEDKINIKEETKQYLEKWLKICERNTQEFCNSIKRPTLRITGIDEGE